MEISSYQNINNLKELLKLRNEKPIIIRNFPLLNIPINDYVKILSSQKEELQGYSFINKSSKYYTGKKTWELFSNGNLDINIVNSPVTDRDSILPLMWNVIVNDIEDEFKKQYYLTWVLSPKNSFSPFHCDPDYDGGFMKLLDGEKVWNLVTQDNWEMSNGKCQIKDVLKIYTGTVKGGDLIWFPKQCFHMVLTTKSSYGFAGYI